MIDSDDNCAITINHGEGRSHWQRNFKCSVKKIVDLLKYSSTLKSIERMCVFGCVRLMTRRSWVDRMTKRWRFGTSRRDSVVALSGLSPVSVSTVLVCLSIALDQVIVMESWGMATSVSSWSCSVLRLHQHSIGYTGDGFYRSKDPTNSIKVLNEHIEHTNDRKIQ